MTIIEDRLTATKEVGNARKRKEDQRLITGRTRWTDNITLPGMLHLAMVRSPYAHANIAAINTDAAKAATGVITVVTGADIKDVQGVVANAWPITGDQKAPPHLPVAVERVACAGEIVAVVVARTPAEARDAAELVDVDYEQLPAVFDLKEAAADTILAHPDLGTNKSASGSSTRRRRVRVAASRRPSPRPGPTASSSSGSTDNSGSSPRSWSRAPPSWTRRASR